MKLKNVWKYVALIGFVNLIILLFYLIGYVILYGIDIKMSLWASQWFGVSMFLILFSVFIAAIGNIKEIISEIIQFLKD